MIQAPETGDYQFYIASDDASELRVSTDDTKINSRKVAGVSLHTKPHEWNKYIKLCLITIFIITIITIMIVMYHHHHHRHHHQINIIFTMITMHCDYHHHIQIMTPTCLFIPYSLHSSPHHFIRYPSQQKSKPIGLEKGKVYYLEALHKEGQGGDHLTASVRLPSGTVEAPLMKNLYTRRPVGKLLFQSRLCVDDYNLKFTFCEPFYCQSISYKKMIIHDISPFQSSAAWPTVPDMA